jgi:hypothetical protein
MTWFRFSSLKTLLTSTEDIPHRCQCPASVPLAAFQPPHWPVLTVPRGISVPWIPISMIFAEDLLENPAQPPMRFISDHLRSRQQTMGRDLANWNLGMADAESGSLAAVGRSRDYYDGYDFACAVNCEYTAVGPHFGTRRKPPSGRPPVRRVNSVAPQCAVGRIELKALGAP